MLPVIPDVSTWGGTPPPAVDAYSSAATAEPGYVTVGAAVSAYVSDAAATPAYTSTGVAV